MASMAFTTAVSKLQAARALLGNSITRSSILASRRGYGAMGTLDEAAKQGRDAAKKGGEQVKKEADNVAQKTKDVAGKVADAAQEATGNMKDTAAEKGEATATTVKRQAAKIERCMNTKN